MNHGTEHFSPEANASFANPLEGVEKPDTPNGLERKKDPREYIEFRFAFYRHASGEDAALVAEYLKDCDIIALEAITEYEPKQKAEDQRLFNDYVQARAENRVDESLDSAVYSKAGLFRYYLLTYLASHGSKPVVLTDLAKDGSQAYQEFRASQMATDDYENMDLFVHSADRRAALSTMLESNARSDLSRAQVVSEQLVNLSESLPSTRKYKIGVGAGATHTDIQHRTSQLGYKSTKQFLDSHPAADPQARESHRWPLALQAERFLQFHPDEHLTDDLLNRILLTDTYHASDLFFDEDEPNPDTANTNAYKLSAQAVEGMDDEQVSHLLKQLDVLAEQTPDEADYEQKVLQALGAKLNNS